MRTIEGRRRGGEGEGGIEIENKVAEEETREGGERKEDKESEEREG